MRKGLTARAEIIINSAPAKIWRALIDPKMIKQYLFGTEAISDWRVGSNITYKGVWQGKAYEDKGTILEMQPEKLLVSTYWSSMSGREDAPENYSTVTYKLEPQESGTKLIVTNDNHPSEEARQHSEQNWNNKP